MIVPHDFQEDIINECFARLEKIRKLCIQANTGAGKTVIMAFICKKWIEEKRGKIVITCDRDELVKQTVSTLSSIGVSSQAFTAKSKHKHSFVDVHCAMIETLNKRIEKGLFSLDGVTLVISDEVHVLVHNKVYDYFPNAKIIGFTATPVLMKRITYFECKFCKTRHNELTECCGFEVMEWTKPYAMSNIYDDIIVGPDFEKLQDIGQLVPEISFKRKSIDTSSLKTDSTGEYTQKSLTETYGSEDSVFNVLLNYEELCKGKRTMVFNPSTKVNKMVYDKFKDAGYNVKLYDSVNGSDVSRTQLVKWFNENDDAILCNCGVFTTGFDSREVQAIIMNRSTKSLSLWLQIAGRGGRSSLKIFKDHFILIDGGGNIDEFGEWSADRDWRDIFFNGIGEAKPKKIMADDIQDCPECGYLFDKYEKKCPNCSVEMEVKEVKEKTEITYSNEVLEPIREIPPPSGRHIYDYTKRQGGNIHFAFKILQLRIVDMFIYYRVSKATYEKTKENGKLDEKVKKMILKPYHFLIKQSDIQNGAHRTINYLIEKTKEKIEKYYS